MGLRCDNLSLWQQPDARKLMQGFDCPVCCGLIDPGLPISNSSLVQSREPVWTGFAVTQRVQAPHTDERGYDAGKKIGRRKRHIAVDTEDRLLLVNVSIAEVPTLPAPGHPRCDPQAVAMDHPSVRRWLLRSGRALMDKAAFKEFVIKAMKRPSSDPGFKVLPRQCVVERTFGWMTRWRRLLRDYEQRIGVSKAKIHVALGNLPGDALPEPFSNGPRPPTSRRKTSWRYGGDALL